MYGEWVHVYGSLYPYAYTGMSQRKTLGILLSISLHTVSLSRLQSLTERRAGLAVSKPQWSSWLYPCRAKLQMCIWLCLYFTWVPRIQVQILTLSWQDPEPSPQPPLCPLIPGYHELRNLQCYQAPATLILYTVQTLSKRPNLLKPWTKWVFPHFSLSDILVKALCTL